MMKVQKHFNVAVKVFQGIVNNTHRTKFSYFNTTFMQIKFVRVVQRVRIEYEVLVSVVTSDEQLFAASFTRLNMIQK